MDQVILEKPVVVQLHKSFPDFSETKKFTVMWKKASSLDPILINPLALEMDI